MFAAFVWFALLIIFLVAEGSTVTLVSIWFALGSLIAMVAALLGGPIWLQVLLFLGVSAALLALLRPLVRKYIKPKVTATNADSLIGSRGYVTETVDNLASTGQVKLGAMPWTARSTDGSPISEGTLVRVDRIEGVKVFVSPVPEAAAIS